MSKAENDILHIRKMMERSSTFISLSGFSGVGAGLVAIGGCITAYYVISLNDIGYNKDVYNYYPLHITLKLWLISLITFFLALFCGIYFTLKNIQKTRESLWNKSLQNMLKAGITPLFVGGIFCILISLHGFLYLVPSAMLIFYGLALINAAQYTKKELYSLGLIQIFLGFWALIFLGYSLLFWGLGFGLLHIIYGIRMQNNF